MHTEVAPNISFPGQYYDADTGHSYNYFRDYDSMTGRYSESDPFGLAGGEDTYLYANANPLSWMDIYGLCPDCRKNCLDTYKRQVNEAYGTYTKAWNFCTKWFSELGDRLLNASSLDGCRPAANQALQIAIKAAQVVRDRCLANCQQGENNGDTNGAMSATPGGGAGLPGH